MKLILSIAMIAMIGFFTACEDDEKAADPFASFQYEISKDNDLEVSFTNNSENAESYTWEFGDGETSTEENPVHLYSEAGSYDVVLTATNADGVSTEATKTIEIGGPNLLAGEDSKTWKLYREGTSMGVGLNPDQARSWWSLENDGSRPCVYKHEFIFHNDGTFEFDDKGMFWGEESVFDTTLAGTCFEATAQNMVNKNGDDVSAWLSGEYEYNYDKDAGEITFNGEGAWMGLPQLGTDGESIVPVESKTFNAEIEEHDGYDLMTVSYHYNEGTDDEIYWDFTYVSYDDWANEPDLVTEEEEFGEDLADITPNEIFVTFASKDAADMATIDTVESGSSVEFGVDDPVDATADKVGAFTRTEGVQYQELQFRAIPDPKDIQFDNFSTVKLDVYVPNDIDFANTDLQKHLVFGFADMSKTEEWWNSPEQYVVEGGDFVVGEWNTYTFDLTATEVLNRTYLDMIYLGIGGGGHNVGATFYVRNLIFE